MAKRTQKAGATGRFGARYGVSVRRNAGMAMKKKSARTYMPNMPVPHSKRKSVGIWHCTKCGYTFAGGAWEPFTRASDANSRIIRRNADGATTADMAFIAQQAAIEYERAMNAGELDEEE